MNYVRGRLVTCHTRVLEVLNTQPAAKQNGANTHLEQPTSLADTHKKPSSICARNVTKNTQPHKLRLAALLISRDTSVVCWWTTRHLWLRATAAASLGRRWWECEFVHRAVITAAFSPTRASMCPARCLAHLAASLLLFRFSLFRTSKFSASTLL